MVLASRTWYSGGDNSPSVCLAFLLSQHLPFQQHNSTETGCLHAVINKTFLKLYCSGVGYLMYTCAMWMVRLLVFDIRGIHSLFLSLHRWTSASVDHFRVLLPVNVMNTVVSLLDLYSQCLTKIIPVACVTVTQQLLVCSVGFCLHR